MLRKPHICTKTTCFDTILTFFCQNREKTVLTYTTSRKISREWLHFEDFMVKLSWLHITKKRKKTWRQCTIFARRDKGVKWSGVFIKNLSSPLSKFWQRDTIFHFYYANQCIVSGNPLYVHRQLQTSQIQHLYLINHWKKNWNIWNCNRGDTGSVTACSERGSFANIWNYFGCPNVHPEYIDWRPSNLELFTLYVLLFSFTFYTLIKLLK